MSNNEIGRTKISLIMLPKFKVFEWYEEVTYPKKYSKHHINVRQFIFFIRREKQVPSLSPLSLHRNIIIFWVLYLQKRQLSLLRFEIIKSKSPLTHNSSFPRNKASRCFKQIDRPRYKIFLIIKRSSFPQSIRDSGVHRIMRLLIINS